MSQQAAVEDAFTRMANGMECPHCGHRGFSLEWVRPEHPSFALSGTTLGADKIPRLTCKGCAMSVDANRAR